MLVGLCLKLFRLKHGTCLTMLCRKSSRVVFDCGATSFKGTSLNDQFLSGPDQTSSLIGVLLRFRKEQVAVIADVKGMFHQVRVKLTDTESLRFLWWPDGDLNSSPEDYQMLVQIFGATSSPSVCSFALRTAALDNEIRVRR